MRAAATIASDDSVAAISTKAAAARAAMVADPDDRSVAATCRASQDTEGPSPPDGHTIAVLGARAASEIWDRLDPGGPPTVVWARPVNADRVALLLGAFDPPTNAHLAIARAAGHALHIPAAFCLTKVLLARGADRLLSIEDRIAALCAISERCGFGTAFANRGTYLEVGRALRSSGIEPTFVVGADKLEQLADPSFYPDGNAGVASTFEELDFVVVPRGDSNVRRAGMRTIDASHVFDNEDASAISASRVRALVRAGSSVDDLVPPEVALALRGYTSAR